MSTGFAVVPAERFYIIEELASEGRRKYIRDRKGRILWSVMDRSRPGHIIYHAHPREIAEAVALVLNSMDELKPRAVAS